VYLSQKGPNYRLLKASFAGVVIAVSLLLMQRIIYSLCNTDQWRSQNEADMAMPSLARRYLTSYSVVNVQKSSCDIELIFVQNS